MSQTSGNGRFGDGDLSISSRQLPAVHRRSASAKRPGQHLPEWRRHGNLCALPRLVESSSGSTAPGKGRVGIHDVQTRRRPDSIRHTASAVGKTGSRCRETSTALRDSLESCIPSRAASPEETSQRGGWIRLYHHDEASLLIDGLCVGNAQRRDPSGGALQFSEWDVGSLGSVALGLAGN